MPMQIRGTLTPNSPPTGLAERQLCVEMASSPPVLWCGVPTSVDASGRVRLNAVGIPEPTTAGNYLRTNTGTWVAGLPLSGGTLSSPGNLTMPGTFGIGNFSGLMTLGMPDFRLISAAQNVILSGLNAAGSAYVDALTIRTYDPASVTVNVPLRVGAPTGTAVTGAGNVNVSGGYYVNGVALAGLSWGNTISGNTGNGIGITNTGTGDALNIVSNTGRGISVTTANITSTGTAIYVNTSDIMGPVQGLQIDSGTINATSAGLRIVDLVPGTGTSPQLWIGYGTTPQFIVRKSGRVEVGVPTGPVVTGTSGTVNVQGDYYVNGVSMGAPSDPLLKDDMQLAPAGALAKVQQVPVQTFRWKDKRDDNQHIGFSAVDVQAVLGEQIGNTIPGTRNYSLPELTAVLWQAVQELSAEVTELRKGRPPGTEGQR